MPGLTTALLLGRLTAVEALLMEDLEMMFDLQLPEWIDADAWAGYLEMRRLIRKPATRRAQALSLRVLAKLRAAGHDPNAVLDQSTQRSWQGLFAVRDDVPQSAGASATPKIDADADAVRAWLEVRNARAHERAVRWSDPRIPEVLRAMGGAQAIADMRTDQVSFMQRDFVRMFRALAPSNVVPLRRAAHG